MLPGVFPRCREWHESTCASVPKAHNRSGFSAPQVKLSVPVKRALLKPDKVNMLVFLAKNLD